LALLIKLKAGIRESSVAWSLDSWVVDPVALLPAGETRDASTRLYSIAPGSEIGVYQELGSRNGGEAVSADSY